MVNNLCIGTAQFGFDYGITNATGKVKEKDVSRILDKAHNAKIKFLDTAQAYLDAEYVLGNNMPKNSDFKIITKLNSDVFDSSDRYLLKNLEISLTSSLKKLKVKSIDSLLIHNVDCFKKSNHNLIFDWLESIKERKLVNRIGISIYCPEDLDDIEIEKFNLIQIPFSIYDQRFLKNNLIQELSKMGISIHLRSIFLQGLILENSELWPNNLSNKFKSHHKSLLKELELLNLNIFEEIIKAPFLLDDVEAVLVGVSSYKEFNEILGFWLNLSNRKFPENGFQFKDWYWDKIDDIDPRKWNLNKK